MKNVYFQLSSDFAFGENQADVVDSFIAIQKLIAGYNPDGTINEEMSFNGLWIQSGARRGDGLFLNVEAMNTNVLGIHGLSVTSYENASDSIARCQSALDSLSQQRSNLGAQQNRLEHTYHNVTNTAENTQAAESRIRDTDMAKEMVSYAKQSILEQAGISVISQANQATQGVLQLLQG